MRYRAAIFDLDGTLADTLRDIAESMNFALAEAGRPPRAIDEYRYLAGQGVDHLTRQALGNAAADEAVVERVKATYLARYGAHKYDHSGPFAGIAEMLDELQRRGVRLAVLSNKPDHATAAMISELFARWRFDVVRGARPGEPLKPHPAAATAVAAALGVRAKECVYVGDTRADMLTGSGAGMFTVGVLWGFRDEAELRESGADAVVQHPRELLGYFGAAD